MNAFYIQTISPQCSVSGANIAYRDEPDRFGAQNPCRNYYKQRLSLLQIRRADRAGAVPVLVAPAVVVAAAVWDA